MKLRFLVLLLLSLLVVSKSPADSGNNCITINFTQTGNVPVRGSWWIASQTITYKVDCMYQGKVAASYVNGPVTGYGTGVTNTYTKQQIACDPLWGKTIVTGKSVPNAYFRSEVWDGQGQYDQTVNAGCYYDSKPYGDHFATTSCGYSSCPIPPPGSSPVLIDLDGKGFSLTDAASGVPFDYSGNGALVQTGWTAKGANNGFLALPGTDGLVHNGTQLFGNYTPQPQSQNPNGFAALAVYDDPKNGGNGDGIIDSRDGIFSSLRVWKDLNHDGVCTKDEMYTLPQVGINSISLHYKEDNRTDAYGNQFRYHTLMNPDKQDEVGRTAYDVFFVTSCN